MMFLSNKRHSYNRTTKVSAFCGALLLSITGCGASAKSGEDFPSKDIRMVISYAAGGATDATGRAIAAGLEEKLGVSVMVENVAGGSGSVGTSQVANAKADGYTIATTTASAVSRVPILQDVSYGLDDLQMFTMAVDGGGVLTVPSDSDYETLDDLIKAAEANPGTIRIGTAGPHSPQHIELERLKMNHGIDFRAIPFEGDAPNATALVGGNVDASFASNNELFVSYVESGEMKPLAISEPDKIDYGQEVPTFVEAGYDDIVYGGSDYVVVGPAGVPDDIANEYDVALKEILAEDKYAQRVGEEYVPEEYVDSASLTDLLKTEQSELRTVLESVASNS